MDTVAAVVGAEEAVEVGAELEVKVALLAALGRRELKR